jgi:actin-related protein
VDANTKVEIDASGFSKPLHHRNADLSSLSLHELLYAGLLRADVDARRDLLSNVILVGGGALIDGIGQRLTYEVSELFASNLKVTLTAIDISSKSSLNIEQFIAMNALTI